MRTSSLPSQLLLAPHSPFPTASPGCTGQICHSSSSDTPLVTSEKINPLSPHVSTLSDVALAAIPLLLPSSPVAILQSRWLLCTPMCVLCWEVCPLSLIFICWLWSLSSFLSCVTFYPRLPELQQVQASTMVYLLTPFKSTQVRAFIFWLYLSPHAHQLFCKVSGLWLAQN